MAYLQHSNWRDRPGAVAGVIGIHAVIGYALVTGLSFKGIVETVTRTESYFVPEVKLPPPPPPPKPDAKIEPERPLANPPISAPLPPVDLSDQRPAIDTTPQILPSQDFVPTVVPTGTPGRVAEAKPAFDPVSARPRNNPGGWVTTNDYRSSWIRSELTGSARFRLTIDSGGRVESCTITASSGHPELDQATCDLVSKRARFDPAKGTDGAPTSGSYSSSVRWELPD